MTRNVGALERKLRALAGIVLVAAAFFIEWPGAWEGIAGLVGAMLFLTALVRYCPFNQLIGRRAHARSSRAGIHERTERRQAILDRRRRALTGGPGYPDRREGRRDRRRYATS